MIKVLIFDADGVLIQTEVFSKHFVKEYGGDEQKIAEFFKTEFLDCIVGTKDLKQCLVPKLQKWGWNKSIDEFLKEWFEYEHKVDEPLIEEIKKYKEKGILCCFATNQEKYRAEYILKEMGFENVFDKIFISHSIGHRKPHKEFFENIMQELLGVMPSEILFWDDKEENIQMAKSLGWNGEVYTTFEDFKKKMKVFSSQIFLQESYY